MKTILLSLFILFTFHESVIAKKFTYLETIIPTEDETSKVKSGEKILGKWFNIEGKRVWEFKANGELLNYSLSAPTLPPPIAFEQKDKTLQIQIDQDNYQQFEILLVDEVQLLLKDKKEDQTFRFIHARTQKEMGDVKELLENNSFQAEEINTVRQTRVFSFRKMGGRVARIIKRELIPDKTKWSIKNQKGFNFLFLNQTMAYVILPIDDKNILLGQMEGKWQLTPYQKINLDYDRLFKLLTGKWTFSINKENGFTAVSIKFKKDNSGLWKSFNKKDKVPITWHLKRGAPILHVAQSANRNVDYLILDSSEDRLVLEELNTMEARGKKWVMYGRRK